MIFSIVLIAIIVVLFIGVILFAALGLSKDEETTKYDLYEPEMVSLDDIPDVEPEKEWQEMTVQEKYENDISESMPEVYKKIEQQLSEEETDYVTNDEEVIEAVEYLKQDMHDNLFPLIEEDEVDFVSIAPEADPEWPILDILLSEELQVWTQLKAAEYDVDYRLVLALMDTESSFRKDIGTEKVLGGSEDGPRYYGYMQLSAENCKNAIEAGIDPHTEKGNIEWGIRYLSDLLHRHDSDIPKAIAAYKGTSNTEHKSVKKVMAKYDEYCEKMFQMMEE